MNGYEFADTNSYEDYGSKRSRSFGGASSSSSYGSFHESDFDDGYLDSQSTFSDFDEREHPRQQRSTYRPPPQHHPQQQQPVRSSAFTSVPLTSSTPKSSNDFKSSREEVPKRPRTQESSQQQPQRAVDTGPRTWDQVRNLENQLRSISLEQVQIVRDLSGPPGTTTAHIIEPGNVTRPTETNLQDHLFNGSNSPSSSDSSSSPPPSTPPPTPPPAPPPDAPLARPVPVPKRRLLAQSERLGQGLQFELETHYRHLKGETLSEKYGRSPYELRQKLGRLRLEKFEKLLDCFEYARTPQQIQIHECMLRVAAQFIMCDEFRAESQDLLKEWGLTRHAFSALFMAGRRGGKTESGTQFNGAVLYLSDYGVQAAVFTTQQGISNLFVASTTRNMIQICNAEKFDSKRKVVRRSASMLETIKYAHHNSNISHAQLHAANNTNSIIGLASNIQGQKGRKVNIANLDEASRIPLLIIYESVAPHVTMGSVVFATSTTLGKEDPFTAMFNSDDPDSKQLVLRVQFKLLCDDCAEKDLDPLSCKHMDHLSTPWQNPEFRVRARILMNNNRAMMLREVYGVPISDNEQVIHPKLIERVFDTLPRFSVKDYFHENPLDREINRPMIYTFVDPGGYSKTRDSETSVCSIIWTKNGKQIVLLGVASANMALQADMRDFFHLYFLKFTQHEYYTYAQHVIAVENNYGGSAMAADNIYQLVKHIVPDAMDMSEAEPKIGVETRYQMKSDACSSLIQYLHEDKLVIVEEKDFISIDGARIVATNSLANRNSRLTVVSTIENTVNQVPPLAEGSLYDRMVKELRDEMSRVRKIQVGATRWGYSGKGPRGSGQRDDKWMALMLSVYWSCQFMNRALLYRDARRHDNQRVFLREEDRLRYMLSSDSYFMPD